MFELYNQWSAILNKTTDVKTALEKLFGETVKSVVTKQAKRLQDDRTQGKLGVSAAGAIGVVSSSVPRTPNHTFYGEE